MGRRPNPGTVAEKAKKRREAVRAHVCAHRRRVKQERENEEKRIASQPDGRADSSSEETVAELSDLTTAKGEIEDLTSRCLHIRLRSVLHDRQTRWLLQPPLHLSFGPAYQEAFVAAWKECCQMPDHNQASTQECIHVNVCCGSWVDSACIRRTEARNDLLSDALLVSALAVVGKSGEHPDMERYAVELESKLYATLRHKLLMESRQYNQDKLVDITMTVLTVAVASLLVKKSWPSFNIHLKGVAALIELAGADSLDSQMAVDQFFAYRAVQVRFSFMERKQSFLSKPEWINFPHRTKFKIASPCLQDLIDVVYAIPTLMHDLDEATAMGFTTNVISSLWERSTRVDSQMEDWEAKYGLQMPWADDNDQAHVQHHDFDATRLVDFDDTTTANLLSFFLGAKVALLDLFCTLHYCERMVNIAIKEPKVPALKVDISKLELWSKRALQCISTFRKLEPRTMGKLICLFPLDMAWRAYCNLERYYEVACVRDIESCMRLAREYESTGLPAL